MGQLFLPPCHSLPRLPLLNLLLMSQNKGPACRPVRTAVLVGGTQADTAIQRLDALSGLPTAVS